MICKGPINIVANSSLPTVLSDSAEIEKLPGTMGRTQTQAAGSLYAPFDQ